MPVAHGDVDVGDRCLDAARERGRLRLRELGHDSRNHHRPAGEHARSRPDAMERSVPYVAHVDASPGITDGDGRGAQPQPDRASFDVERRVVEP